IHQITDMRNDAHTATRTFARTRGAAFSSRLISLSVFPLELLSLVIAMFTMCARVPTVWPLAIMYILWLQLRWGRLARLGKSLSPFTYGLLADLYCAYWPLWLAALLSIRNFGFLCVLVFTIVLLLRKLRQLIGEAKGLFAVPVVPRTPLR